MANLTDEEKEDLLLANGLESPNEQELDALDLPLNSLRALYKTKLERTIYHTNRCVENWRKTLDKSLDSLGYFAKNLESFENEFKNIK